MPGVPTSESSSPLLLSKLFELSPPLARDNLIGLLAKRIAPTAVDVGQISLGIGYICEDATRDNIVSYLSQIGLNLLKEARRHEYYICLAPEVAV